MDKKVIETEATSSVKILIRRNPYLSPYIDENDKTPIWDGSIYVYSTENSTQSNKVLLGRVPTQIKGHYTKKGFPEEVTYPVQKDDLRVYQTEGGIVFIVVYIDDLFVSKVYYEQLLPLDIERLLIQMEHQDSKSIAFKMMPRDDLQLANLFLNFIEDRKKQMGTVDKNKLHLSDWEDCSEIGIYKFHISSVKTVYFNPLQALSTSTVYLYGKPSRFDLEIPMERLDHGIVQTTKVHSIGCCEQIFYLGDATTTIWENGNLSVKFGKAMSIDVIFLGENKISGTFHFNLEGSLNERLVDSDFVLAVLDKSSITINTLPLSINKIEQNVIIGTTEHIQKLKSIRNKLDELHISDDLHIEKMNKNELWKLNLLLEINEEIDDKYLVKKNQFSLFQIANIQLTIFSFIRDEKLYVRDFFSDIDQFVFSFSMEDGTHCTTSRFLYLKENALISSNVFAELIYFDIIKYDSWDAYYPNVNMFLLECLKAYDSGKGRHDELFKLACMISEWLLIKEPESETYQINHLQTQVRKRTFTTSEKSLIKMLASTDNESWAIRCGALILDADYTQASQLLQKQTCELQQEFKSYPIYYLLKLSEMGNQIS